MSDPSMMPPAAVPEASANPPAPPPIDLTIAMGEEEQAALGKRLKQEIERYLEDTAVRRSSCQQWRRDFELYPAEPSTRWENGAAVSAPLAHIYCQNHHVRLNQQIIHAIPPFAVMAREPAALDAVPQIEEALTACLEEAAWATIADLVHSELPQVGNCFLRVAYEEETQRSPRQRYDWDEDAFEQLVLAGVPPLDAFFAAIKKDAQGNPVMKLGWATILKHAGVKLRVIPFEDGVILPAGIRDPEDAQGIGERLMIRGAELRAGAKSGRYFAAAVEQLLMSQSDEEAPDRADTLAMQGTAPAPSELTAFAATDAAFRRYLCYEFCWKQDYNEDGEEEWGIITLHAATGRILRAQYLPFEHGRPCYSLFRYFTRARELWGMGVAEKLACIQDAATSVLNQLIDHADLALNAAGNFFYDDTSGIDIERFEFQMGRPVRCESVEGVKPFPIQPLPPEHYELFQLLKSIAELVTATSSPSLGQETDAKKTLGEIQIVTGASNMIFEEVAARVARAWAEVWDQVRWLAGQYGDGGVVRFRRSAAAATRITPDPLSPGTGEALPPDFAPTPAPPPFGEIDAETLLAEVDLVPTGLKQLADIQSRTQQAASVQQVLLTHPLTAQNPEVLLIALDEFLQAVRYPQREKILAAVQQALAAQAQMAMMAAQQAAQGAASPPGDLVEPATRQGVPIDVTRRAPPEAVAQ